jgi:TonB family protein
MPLFAFALLLLQFVHNSPNTPVVTAPVLHYQLPPDLATCKLVPPFKMTTSVAINVGIDGNAHGVHLAHSSGNACVDKQTLAAAAHFRFAPALKETKPIPATITLTMNTSRDR